jgi:hypothetical protein
VSSRKPTRAVPTAGLLRVQRNANHDRLLSGFRGKTLEILDGGQLAEEMFRADRRNARYLLTEQGS